MQDAQAHTRFQQLQRGRELTAAESSKVQSRVMDSLGQKPADFSKGQSMSGSGSPWAQQVNVRAAETMCARWMATLQQNCPWTLVSTSYQSCMSKNVILLIFLQSLKRTKSFHIWWSTGTGCQTSQEPRNITSRKKNGTASLSLPS